MRSITTATALLTTLLLAAAERAAAQQDPWSRPAPGTFGPRTLGQTLRPRPSRLTGAMQRGPSGNFLSAGRPSGNMFATPWRPDRSAPVVYYGPTGVAPVLVWGPQPQAPAAAPVEPNGNMPNYSGYNEYPWPQGYSGYGWPESLPPPFVPIEPQ